MNDVLNCSCCTQGTVARPSMSKSCTYEPVLALDRQEADRQAGHDEQVRGHGVSGPELGRISIRRIPLGPAWVFGTEYCGPVSPNDCLRSICKNVVIQNTMSVIPCKSQL